MSAPAAREQIGLPLDGAAAADAGDDAPAGRTVSFVIPGAPIAKGRPKTAVVNGRAIIYTPSKTRREEGAIRLMADEAMAGAAPIEGPIAVAIVHHMPIPASWSGVKQRRARDGLIMPTGRPDWENLAKLALDALNGIVYRDDAQIVSAQVAKRYSTEPRTEISVTALQAERA